MFANEEDMKYYNAKFKHYLTTQESPWKTHFYLARARCNNPKSTGYYRYGGRGIKFKLTLEEVKTLFERDNARELEKASIDRIYNDGDYTFGNCRFIEMAENSSRAHRKNVK